MTILSPVSVMLSINPHWCELIATGQKTIELRKTKPKIKTPFKCYIYCTRGKNIVSNEKSSCATGKVVGEFICDKVLPIRVFKNGTIQDYNHFNLRLSCVPYDDISKYIGNNHTGYGWHITNVVIYDKPRELCEFEKCPEGGTRPCEVATTNYRCEYEYFDISENCRACSVDFDGTGCPKLSLKRPPQSWCYVVHREPAKPCTQVNSEAMPAKQEIG